MGPPTVVRDAYFRFHPHRWCYNEIITEGLEGAAGVCRVPFSASVMIAYAPNLLGIPSTATSLWMQIGKRADTRPCARKDEAKALWTRFLLGFGCLRPYGVPFFGHRQPQ